jgi:hypothetical protein
MNALLIEATKKTPDVNLDYSNGILEISGMSCSENALGFFNPIFDWIKDYVSQAKDVTTMNFKLKYYNTSSAKCILDVLDKLLIVKESGKQLIVNWYYDPSDDEMLESGENYSTILDHPFNFIEL